MNEFDIDIEEENLNIDEKQIEYPKLTKEELFEHLNVFKYNYQEIEKEIEEIRQNYRKDGKERFEEWDEKMLYLVQIKNFLGTFIDKIYN